MMIETMMSRSLRMVFSSGVVVAAGVLATSAQAQEAADSATATQVQRVEITGSNIRRVDAETPSPVQVISADDLKKSGYTSVVQVLQNITANGQGTLSQGNTVAFAAGASGISLRGLNTSATLVLIDGHRMAPNALSDDGQRSFVDVSNIPFDTIERIEILKDGASATYGSDAMAGVVNVILKKSFTGTTVNAEGGSTTEGGGATAHTSITSGFGDLADDGYNAYASVEYRRQNDITQASRANNGLGGGWTTMNFTPQGGLNGQPGTIGPFTGIAALSPGSSGLPAIPGSPYLYNPAAAPSASTIQFLGGGSCTSYSQLSSGGCAYAPLGVIQPETSNLNILGSFTKRLSGDWQLGLKASLFESKDDAPSAGLINSYPVYQTTFNPLIGVSSGVPGHLVGTPIPEITVPANYPGNNLGAPAEVIGFDPSGPTTGDHVVSKSTRLVADINGTLGDWDVSAAAGYTRSQVEQTSAVINVPALNAALNLPVNPYLITGPNSPALVASIYQNASAVAVSDLSFLEVHGSRSLMPMAGGDLALAVGASYIDHTLNAPAPASVAQGLTLGGNVAFAEGSQSNEAIFTELVAPVTKTLELDGSARYDHFNDGNEAVTPKAAFKWAPTQVFALRGTVATGFRAPNPAENGSAGQLYGGSNYDAVNCPGGPSGNASGKAPAAGSFIPSCGFYPVLNTTNPNLKPEKSLSETLGMILEPIHGWSSTLDLFRIRIKDQIVAPTPPNGSVVRSLTAQTGPCADGNGGTYTCTIPGSATTGVVVFQNNLYVNANSTTVSGLELESHYKIKLGDYGSLMPSFDWSHTMSYLLDTSTGDFQLAGTHGPSIIGGNTANPKDRFQASFTYALGAFDVTTAFNIVGKYSVIDPSFYEGNCQATLASGVQTIPYFANGNAPSNYCEVKSFVDTDLTLRYKISKQLNVHFAVNNLFNQQPPVDMSTYGGLPFQYNPSLHMAGAIGRFMQAGLTYSF
jgi:iron complex outermembrane receptor protein